MVIYKNEKYVGANIRFSGKRRVTTSRVAKENKSLTELQETWSRRSIRLQQTNLTRR